MGRYLTETPQINILLTVNFGNFPSPERHSKSRVYCVLPSYEVTSTKKIKLNYQHKLDIHII